MAAFVAVSQSQLQRWGGMLAEETVAVAERVGQAVEDHQNHIFEQAQGDVPVLTGALKGTIRRTGRSPVRRRVRAGGARAFYARFQEFGTRHHQANRFLITHAELDPFERRVAQAMFEAGLYRGIR